MRIFLSIIVLAFFFSGKAYSKIVNLHCKYLSTQAKYDKEIINYDLPKILKDYKIKLDITKKNIIKAPNYINEKSRVNFNEDRIIWWGKSAPRSVLIIKMTLNRYSGQLTEYHKNYIYRDKKNNYWKEFIFNCSKAKRLF